MIGNASISGHDGRNPLKRDFYVYQFAVDGYPFYVGIGRSERGTDRLRYVRSLSAVTLPYWPSAKAKT
jgi:hypothetical protein